ncbi:MAG: glycoside hydrolase family 97 N-terminal domain-containing protein, partial [Chitinophagales bacterium]
MKRLRKFLYLFIPFLTQGLMAQEKVNLIQQMNKVKLTFTLDERGGPSYSIDYDNKPVVLTSRLGFLLNEDRSLFEGFEIRAVDKRIKDETWQPVWGETKSIRNHYQELIIHLAQKSGAHHLLNIVFHVFEDGVAFRYEFPLQPNLKYFIVSEELTSFHLNGDHKTFWIPGDFDSNEYPYTISKISEIDNAQRVAASTDIAVRDAPDRYSVQTPLLMKTADRLYINIHEAALINYPAMQLHADIHSNTFTASLVPDPVGNKAYLHAPCSTPWRTVILSDHAAGILESKMILNQNEPSKIKDPSWIHPMKFVGVWWELQTGKSTWNYTDYPDSLSAGGGLIPNGRHGANTANVKHYIDFAAKHHFGGVLVEGWNRGWEDWFGNWKENVFDFTTP